MFKKSSNSEDLFYSNALKRQFGINFKDYKTLYNQVKRLVKKTKDKLKLEEKIKHDIDVWKKTKDVTMLDKNLDIIEIESFQSETLFEDYDVDMTKIAIQIDNDIELLEEISRVTEDLEIAWIILDMKYHWKWQIKFVSDFIIEYVEVRDFKDFVKYKTSRKDKLYLKSIKKYYKDRNGIKYGEYIEIINQFVYN